MRRLAIVVGSFLLLSSALAPAGGGARAKFEQRIQGSWIAENAPNRLLTHLVVSQGAQGLWLEIWATRGLKDEVVQKAPLHLLRAGIGEKGPVERGFATWKEGLGAGEATVYTTLRFHEAQLVLDLAKVYREPRYANWFTSFGLKKEKS